MKCEEIKDLIVDFIYGELKDDDQAKLQDHLSSCPHCHQEVESLKKTSTILQKWEDVDPKLNLVFVQEKESFLKSFIPKLSWQLRGWRKLAYGAAAILIILSLINTKISYQKGNFDLKMSFLPQSREQVVEKPNLEEMLAQWQQQNLYLMSQMITASEERQRRELSLALTQFAQDWERQRRSDLSLVGRSLEDFQYRTDNRLQRTNELLNGLIKVASFEKNK